MIYFQFPFTFNSIGELLGQAMDDGDDMTRPGHHEHGHHKATDLTRYTVWKGGGVWTDEVHGAE